MVTVLQWIKIWPGQKVWADFRKASPAIVAMSSGLAASWSSIWAESPDVPDDSGLRSTWIGCHLKIKQCLLTATAVPRTAIQPAGPIFYLFLFLFLYGAHRNQFPSLLTAYPTQPWNRYLTSIVLIDNFLCMNIFGVQMVNRGSFLTIFQIFERIADNLSNIQRPGMKPGIWRH